MIRVKRILIKEFRGIRDLTLHLNGKNFAICGANGTGKSGVVDALEFALTGNVSRLSGEGRGDVSLKEHGPHVDIRTSPDKASVSIEIEIPTVNKTATITRTLKSPATPTIMPRDPDVLGVLKRTEEHPEIVLSRRELIRYVLATPGKRAEEVQALLHLEQVEKVRAGLQRIANREDKQALQLAPAATAATNSLLLALELKELKAEALLHAANTKRAILSLPALARLTESTSLKDGLSSPARAQPQAIPRAQALADISAARTAISKLTGAEIRDCISDINNDLTALAKDPAAAVAIQRETFYSAGMDLLDIAACPLCDTEWNLEELKRHVQTKIERMKDVSRQRQAIERKLGPAVVALRGVQSSLDTIVQHAELAKPVMPLQPIRDYRAACLRTLKALDSVFPIAEFTNALAAVALVPQGIHDAVSDFEKYVVALPEPTKQDAAREWLAVAQERLEVWRAAMRNHKATTDRARSARLISDTYAAASDKLLAGIYAKVQRDFGALYSMVNSSDEKKFTAKLVPSMGKLGFDVDFYGRGFFPPGAYHSEGHQDGMGLCLYLALMRHLHASDFTIAILDDVLMSVDAGHRREVCSVLRKEFGNTQFIMTTHDPIWLRHMTTEQLISSSGRKEFKAWSVDEGPTEWDERDVWAELDDYLKGNQVRDAASLLRHYLEYISAELCYRLHARVGLRGDARYQLGELLPAAIGHLRDLYAAGKKAAHSWNQRELVDQLKAREQQFAKVAATSNVEQWQVNVAVHYSSWDTLGKRDFQPVVKAFRELLSGFTCQDCGEYLRVSPDREAPESVRCECGKTNLNLRTK